MINDGHIQLAMSVIKINNDKRKELGKVFIDNEGIKKIQSKFIRVANKVNWLEDRIYNNTFSNWLKIFLSVKTEYPIFLYCDDDEEYIYEFKKEYQEKKWYKRVFGNKLIDVETSVTNLPEYAVNYNKLFWFQRNRIIRDVNKFFTGDKVFRWKRIATYN